MGIQLKGVTLKGLQLKGREWLLPTDIATLFNWYKWKEGLTIDGSNKVSAWATSGGTETPSMVQGTAAKRPAYDAATGKIQFDGVDDFLVSSAALPALNLPAGAEITFVMERATIGQSAVCRMRSAGSSDGNRTRVDVTSVGQILKTTAVGTGQPIYTVGGSVGPGKHVISFEMQTDFYVDGVKCQYSSRAPISNYTDNDAPRWMFGCLGDNPGPTGFNFSNVAIYEFCMHNKRLSSLERSKLVNYLKVKHEIE